MPCACLLLQVQRRCIRIVNVMSPSRQETVVGEYAVTLMTAAGSGIIVTSGYLILQRELKTRVINLKAKKWHDVAAPRHSEQISRHAGSAMITRKAVQGLEVSTYSSSAT